MADARGMGDFLEGRHGATRMTAADVEEQKRKQDKNTAKKMKAVEAG